MQMLLLIELYTFCYWETVLLPYDIIASFINMRNCYFSNDIFLLFIFAVKLFEGTVSQRKTIIDPFVWITSRITQPQSKWVFDNLFLIIFPCGKHLAFDTNVCCICSMYYITVHHAFIYKPSTK